MSRPERAPAGRQPGRPDRGAPRWRRLRSPTLLLLRPKLLTARQGVAGAGESSLRSLLVAIVGGLAGISIYVLATRFLADLREVPEVGPLLAAKLLGLGLLLFLCILLLSNVIGALSSFFLARDLPALLATPVDWLPLYGARLGETLVSSSWMVVFMLVPVLAAYQVVYGAGPAFYAVAAAALLPFLVIPAALGSAVTLLLVRVFPARRTRDLLAVVGGAAAALLVLGLRVLRPERLVRPEGFRNLVDFLEVLRGPSSAWLPSEWVAECLTGHLEGRIDPFWLLLLWTTAGAAVVGGAALHRALYPRAFARAQEGSGAGVRAGWTWNVLGALLRPLGLTRRELVLKDVRLFFRDSTQWSQLLILGVLLVVYVYNMRVLPLQSGEGIGRFLVSVVALLNLGLTGFVLAAVAARFVFPALSLEGRTLWLLRSSPLPADALLWSKYWTGAVPLLTLAVLLTALTGLMLGVERGLFVLSLISVAAVTFALVAQALAWGIAFPKFETENAAQIPTSVGGLLFMVLGLATLGAVLAAQFWSLRGYLWSGLPGRVPRTAAPEEIALAALLTLGICGAGTLLPYRAARRRLAQLGG